MDISKKLEFFSIYEVYEEKRGDCHLCALSEVIEGKYLKTLLNGELLNQPEFHREIAGRGLCAPHLNRLFSIHDKFGLALLLEGYLKKRVMDIQQAMRRGMPVRGNSILHRLLPHRHETKQMESCLICTYMQEADWNNVQLLLMALKEDPLLRERFRSNYSIMCHKHFMQVLSGKREEDPEIRAAASLICSLQTEALHKMQDDLQWFISKFNYKNHQQPWHDARDSLQRVIKYLQ